MVAWTPCPPSHIDTEPLEYIDTGEGVRDTLEAIDIINEIVATSPNVSLRGTPTWGLTSGLCTCFQLCGHCQGCQRRKDWDPHWCRGASFPGQGKVR